eukprot:11626935-Prorocentrum_lima.AAC.1
MESSRIFGLLHVAWTSTARPLETDEGWAQFCHGPHVPCLAMAYDGVLARDPAYGNTFTSPQVQFAHPCGQALRHTECMPDVRLPSGPIQRKPGH